MTSPVLPAFDLSGRRALVTGARRGIGLAMSIALAEAGADIVAVSSSLESSGSDVAQRVTALGRHIEVHAIDLSDREQVDTFTSHLESASAPIDILVNNAGVISRDPAVDGTDEDWDHVIEVNLTAAYRLARSVGGSMLERGRGKIIFTASVLSFQGGIHVPSYSASKWGVAGLTKSLANEWAGRGVNVNAIAPGYIVTDNTQALQDDPARSQAIVDRIPAGRWGEPSDVAGATVFLASPASDYVHGVVLPVDGGWLSR